MGVLNEKRCKKSQIENFSESESNPIYKDPEYKDVINSLSRHINRDNIICKVFGILFLFLLVLTVL